MQETETSFFNFSNDSNNFVCVAAGNCWIPYHSRVIWNAICHTSMPTSSSNSTENGDFIKESFAKFIKRTNIRKIVKIKTHES